MELPIVQGIVPLVGWRSYSFLRPYYLQSGGHLVEPKKHNEAECRYGKEHVSPAETCSCGHYAFKTLEQVAESAYATTQVIAEVWLYGKVIEYSEGFRAQFAYPKACWWNPSSYEDKSWAAKLSWIGHVYGVEFRERCEPLVELVAAKEAERKSREEEKKRRKLMDKKEAQREYHRERNARLKREREELEARVRLLERKVREVEK